MEKVEFKNHLMVNKDNFGIENESLDLGYLNITAKVVKAMTCIKVREIIPLPSIHNIMNSCKGFSNFSSDIDMDFAHFRVTSATEKPVDCDTDNPGVRIRVEGQVIVRTLSNRNVCSSYIAIPITAVDEVVYNFCSTSDGNPYYNLKELLSYIEGSSMCVMLNSKIVSREIDGVMKYFVRIKGSITDSLWKYESVWLEGYAPCPYDALTFSDTFAGYADMPSYTSLSATKNCACKKCRDKDSSFYGTRDDDLDLL